MILYLNDLDQKYPYVDNVKPFFQFLQLFGASALRPGFGSVQAAVAVAAMNAFLTKTLVTRPKDVLNLDMDYPNSASSLVLTAFEKATTSCQRAFIDQVIERGYRLSSNPRFVLSNEKSAVPFLDFLSQNLEILTIIESGPSESTLKLGTSFITSETDELSKQALKITAEARNNAQFVIMGHTHEVVDKPGYINTGSWTRYYKVRKREHLRPWTVLRAGSWKDFPYQLHYALVRPAASPAAAIQTYK